MGTAHKQLEGTWEEIVAESAAFAGHRVRVTLIPAPVQARAPKRHSANKALLHAIEEVARLQQGVSPHKPGAADSVALVREARSGAMYGTANVDDA